MVLLLGYSEDYWGFQDYKPLSVYCMGYRDNAYIPLKMKKTQEIVGMNKTQKPNSFLFVGIMSSEDNLQSRVTMALNTWIPTIQGDVKFFIARNAEISSEFKTNNAIKLPLTKAQDVQAPQQKYFLMLKYMCKMI